MLCVYECAPVFVLLDLYTILLHIFAGDETICCTDPALECTRFSNWHIQDKIY